MISIGKTLIGQDLQVDKDKVWVIAKALCQPQMTNWSINLVKKRDHPPEMPQNIMGIAPFALDYYTAQYDEFMAEQYYLNEK